MKFILFTLLGLLCCQVVIAQNYQFEWAAAAACDNDNSYPNETTIDNNGNSYLTGEFSGNLDLDPSATVQNVTSAGNHDIFLIKLDPQGNLLWGFRLGSTGDDRGESVRTDGAGNIYLAGHFENTVDFDPNAGTQNISANGRDIFILKLDPNGNLLWARTMGGNNSEYISRLAIDNLANVYAAGYFASSPMDFDPGAGTYNLNSTGYLDGFVLKLDSSGLFGWANAINVTSGGTLDDAAILDISIDNQGNLYGTGQFKGSIDLDPTTGGTNIETSNGLTDVFVFKWDNAGNHLYGHALGGTNSDVGRGIAVDDNNNLYLTGTYRDSMDFNPEPSTTWGYSPIGDGYFLQKYDAASGSMIWTRTFGDSSSCAGRDIAFGTDQNIYITGDFTSTVDFDPGLGSDTLQAAGRDAFVHKLDLNGNHIWVYKTGGANTEYGYTLSLGSNSEIVSCGLFQNTVDFDPGAAHFDITTVGLGDPFIQKYTQCFPTSATLNETICTGGSFNFNGQVISLAGTYYDTLTNQGGCDSVMTLDLTVNQLGMGTDTITACNSYSWIDGNRYSNSTNLPTFTIPGGAANGCDSIITLDLTINSVDSLVSLTGNSLVANQPTASTYQWLDCDGGNAPIAGATSQAFSPASSGNYAVEVTANGCTATSACTNIILSSIHTNKDELTTTLFPNPVQNQLQINFNHLVEVSIRLISINGKVLQEQAVNTQQINLEMGDYPAGLYILQVQSAAAIEQHKIIKQ